MKKVLFALLAVAFSSSAYASCGSESKPYYKVQNGKITKSTAEWAVCSNIDQHFNSYKFKDGVQLYLGTDGNSLGKSKPKKVKRPNSVPNSFVCFQRSTGKGATYCVTQPEG